MEEISIMKTNSQDVRIMWDKIGAGLSGLCLIHCLIMPVFAAAMPWLGSLIEDERIHLAFAAVTVPVAIIAFVPGYLKHHRRWVLALGLAGAALLLLGALGHEWVPHELEHWFTVFGGMLLVTGHYLNFRFGSKCCRQELCSNHGS
jgi:hypothetical protein